MPNPEPSQADPPQHRLLRTAQQYEVRPRNLVLPLSAFVWLNQQNARISAKSQVEGLLANRLLVANPQHWKILLLRVGPRIGGLEIRGNHPALLDPRPGTPSRLPRLSIDSDVSLEVEYVGPRPNGDVVKFEACLCMEDATPEGTPSGAPGQPAARIQAPLTFHVESSPTARGRQIRLALPPRAHDLHDTSLALRVPNPEHWIVEDLLIGDDTLLVEAGNLPGELFAWRLGRAPLNLGRLRAREELIVQAAYSGPLDAVSLSYEVSGHEMPANEAVPVSAFLAMSGTPIQGTRTALILGKASLPKGYAFLPEEIVLRDSHKWSVKEIKSGLVSQFAQLESVPGVLFGEGARGCQLCFDPLPRDTFFSMHAEYTPPAALGDPFTCGVVGRVIRLPPANPFQ